MAGERAREQGRDGVQESWSAGLPPRLLGFWTDQLACGPQEACERSLAQMESSHQQVMEELQRHHERELQRLQQEKEWLLAEETAATAAGEDPRQGHVSHGGGLALRCLPPAWTGEASEYKAEVSVPLMEQVGKKSQKIPEQVSEGETEAEDSPDCHHGL